MHVLFKRGTNLEILVYELDPFIYGLIGALSPLAFDLPTWGKMCALALVLAANYVLFSRIKSRSTQTF